MPSVEENSEAQKAVRSRVNRPAVDSKLPEGSLLRAYLATKRETALQCPVQDPPDLIRVAEPSPKWPNVLLAMPPICLSDGAVKRVIPPLGILYVAAYLESTGIPCDILDCVVEGLDSLEQIENGDWRFGLTESQVRERLAESSCEILGLSVLYSSDLDNLYHVARIAKSINPAVVVVAGGLHPSIYPREVLQRGKREDAVPLIDFVIRGEGEHRFAQFVTNYRNGVVDRSADGLCGWYGNELFLNPQIESISNLDALPYPAYSKIPLEKYFHHNVPFSPFPKGKRVMQIYTSRGCPVGCTFCASTNFNKAFRSRSVENVIEEIEYYKTEYEIDEIQFADDNLTFNRKRAMKLFHGLRDVGLPWCTPNGIMVNTLFDELIVKMVESGLYQITMSLDSAVPKTLTQRHRKPVNLDRVPGLMAQLKRQGILIHGTLVVGMPGETVAEIKSGFEFVMKLPFDSLGVFIAQALPGSELFETELAKNHVSVEESQRINTARCSIDLPGVEKSELENLVHDFLQRFNREARRRDPGAWERKYQHHLSRLKSICVGTPAPNSGTILTAAGDGVADSVGSTKGR